MAREGDTARIVKAVFEKHMTAVNAYFDDKMNQARQEMNAIYSRRILDFIEETFNDAKALLEEERIDWSRKDLEKTLREIAGTPAKSQGMITSSGKSHMHSIRLSKAD